ncbi:rhomboid domain-containing 2 [Pelobates cultripes]|uniref:Rhomboid domain-containing 2 n=1 Tax=Pelobates cultripes TaxID=61616 RepID=A0AAD1T8E3_PELCU|nr:rhomboid domain-containing 2 [Pelobates cultripes]
MERGSEPERGEQAVRGAMEEAWEQKKPWWKSLVSFFPQIRFTTAAALTILLSSVISGPTLLRVVRGEDVGVRYDLEAGVLESFTVYRLITYIYFHDDLRSWGCSCLTIWYFGAGFEESFGTVKFCLLTPLFSVCVGTLYLAITSTGLSLPVGDGRVQGFTAMAFCMVTIFCTKTRLRRIPVLGFMVPIKVLPGLFLFPALFIPHAPVFSNMCGILVGAVFGLGGCFCLDFPEFLMCRVEQMLPFRLLKRIPMCKYIPASMAERSASQTRKINPPPGSYPVQQYYTPPQGLPNTYSPYQNMKPVGNLTPSTFPATSLPTQIGITPGQFHQPAQLCPEGHSHADTCTPSAIEQTELIQVQTR